MIHKYKFGISPFPFSCINSSIEDVEKDLRSIVFSTFGENWIKSEYKLSGARQVSTFLQESHLKSIKFLLWTPMVGRKRITIFLSNASDGWITLLNNYARKRCQEFVMAVFSDSSTEYPLYKFYYRKAETIRIVQVLKDTDEWKFYTEGLPLEIEDIENYKRKKISDRFNNSILEQYLEKMGFDCSSEAFWQSMGDAIEYKFAPVVGRVE